MNTNLNKPITSFGSRSSPFDRPKRLTTPRFSAAVAQLVGWRLSWTRSLAAARLSLQMAHSCAAERLHTVRISPDLLAREEMISQLEYPRAGSWQRRPRQLQGLCERILSGQPGRMQGGSCPRLVLGSFLDRRPGQLQALPESQP